jgi:hypothetical protein
MRKILAITLALVMCLALMPLTAMANPVTVTQGGITVQFEKSNFGLGEYITATISGVTQPAEGGYYVQFITLDDGRSNAFRGVNFSLFNNGVYEHDFQVPSRVVRCEYQLTSGDYLEDGGTLIASVPFTVGMADKEGVITLDKTAYTAMEWITVSNSGITQTMLNSDAGVGLYRKGAKHDEGMGYHRFTSESGTTRINAPNENGAFEMRLYGSIVCNDDTFVMSVPFTVSGAVTASNWAREDLAKAEALGLIPDSLKGADLTKPITRAEFAAVAVAVYENLTGSKTTPSPSNTFTDTQNAEVLKAHNTGLMVGISADKFEPNTLLNREQAATALTRVLKRAYIPGWTFATDGSYTLSFTKPANFADDAQISGFAKDSVYFMAANGIIAGVGDNKFAPRAVTSAELAAGYASATREQAIIIGMRLVDNLKDKPLNFTQ